MTSLDRERWGTLSPLLDRAMDLDPDELAGWLASLRAERPVVAADLEALLAGREAMQREGFLEAPASTGTPARTLGPYRLIRVLGEGGMGTVHLAEQTGKIHRLVALKVIRPGLDSDPVMARFAAETQILADLDHPNICRIHEAGATPDGRPYVVMEYVAGTSLTRFCDDGCLPVGERLELFLQVCAAIQHAHQKGVLHRDIKPSNVLVSVVDGRPLVKVIDFGIAKALQPSAGGPALTQTGTTLGTPEYMSPEQAGFDRHDVDTRSDVYALGVVLYELLAGARPFEATDLARPGSLALLEAVRDREPPRLTARLLHGPGDPGEIATWRGTDPKRLARQLAGDLEWITLRALEKQPERRYASPAELAADVDRHLKGEPVLAGPPSTLYRLRKLARRHRLAVGALTVVTATLLVGGVVSSVSLVRAVRAERLGRERLRQSLMTQAHILTGSGELDRRARTLAVLKEAAAISPGLDARNAAIAALAAPGFRVVRRWAPLPAGSLAGWIDASLTRYARWTQDGSVSVHAVEDDRELLRLPRTSGTPRLGAFSPDGRWIVAESLERDVHLWDLSTRTRRPVPRAVAHKFTADSRRLIVLTERNLHLFDLETGQETRVERAPTSYANLAMHPTQPLFLVVQSGSRVLEVRRTADGSLVRQLPVPELGLRAAWTADGVELVTTHVDYSVRVWSWPAVDDPRLILRFHGAEPNWLATDPKSELLGTAGWDNQIAFFDLHDGRLLLTFAGHRVVAASDRAAFLTADAENWQLITLEPPFALDTIGVHEADKSPRNVAFSPDGRWLATTGPDGVRLLDRRSRRVQRVLEDEPVRPLMFTSDSAELRVITKTRLLAWRLPPDDASTPLPVVLDRPCGMKLTDQDGSQGVFSADGARWLRMGPHPGTGRPAWLLGRFDAPEVRPIEGLERTASGVQMSNDGRWLAWGNWQGQNAHAVAIEAGAPIVEFPVAGSAVVAFTPDSRHLMVTGPDVLRLLEVGSWRQVYAIPRRPPGRSAPQVAFSHDSRLGAVILTGRVMLFDAATGREVASLPTTKHALQAAFGPRGFLAVTATDHHVLLWDLGQLRTALREIGLDWD